MNTLERFIYDLVKRNPKVKLFIRDHYQKLFDLAPSPTLKTPYSITVRKNHFFGFHDLSPFNNKNTMMLSNRIRREFQRPSRDNPLEVGFFDGPNFEEYHPLATTYAWNWHMGCRLQWRGDSNQILFNDNDGKKNISRCVDVRSGKESRLEAPIGSVSSDGRYAVGYSFSRVFQCMPGYGYPYEEESSADGSQAPENNGLHIIDLQSGQISLLFSVSEIAKIDPEPSMNGRYHFISHTVFSPDSQRFLFLHRWTGADVQKRWTRMVSADLNGENIHVFPTQDMVSHIGWKDSGTVIAYARTSWGGDDYYLFSDQSQSAPTKLAPGLYSSDGHPSFEPHGRWMVTDTYPDRRRAQTLVLHDSSEGTRFDIAKLPSDKRFQSPSPYLHWACDLHPRWDREGRFLCFDTTHLGYRAQCTIDLGKPIYQKSPQFLSKKSCADEN